MGLYVVQSFDHCIHHFVHSGHNSFIDSDSQCIIQCVHIASGADCLIKTHHYESCIRAYSNTIWPFFAFFFHEIINNFEEFFSCCASFYRFVEKYVSIICCIFNISHISYQVTNTTTVSRFVNLLKKNCFSTSLSAVLLSLLIYQQSIEKPYYFIVVFYKAVKHIFHQTLFVPCMSQQGELQFQQSCAASCSMTFCMTLDKILTGLGWQSRSIKKIAECIFYQAFYESILRACFSFLNVSFQGTASVYLASYCRLPR
jgi:hypothetical protein